MVFESFNGLVDGILVNKRDYSGDRRGRGKKGDAGDATDAMLLGSMHRC